MPDKYDDMGRGLGEYARRCFFVETYRSDCDDAFTEKAVALLRSVGEDRAALAAGADVLAIVRAAEKVDGDGPKKDWASGEPLTSDQADSLNKLRAALDARRRKP